MKILRLYPRLPPLLGGMENHIAQLTREQIKLGHDVIIFFNQGHNVTDNDVQLTKIPLYKIKPQFLGVLIFHFLVLIRLLVKRDTFDLVHIHGDWSSLVFAKFIKMAVCAKKLVFTIHDELYESILKKKLLAISLIPVDVIFATGNKAGSEISSLTRKKVVVQPSGISKIFFNKNKRYFDKEQLQVITVSNLIKKKNLGFILDIAKEKPSLNFIIVGKGKERKFLEQRIIRESITNLTILDFKSPKELLTLYYQSDLFLFTSIKEGTPTVALEAMACGLPIISSPAGGLELIIGTNNFIIKSQSLTSFIDKLSILERNETLRELISIENTLNAQKYSWLKVAKNIDNYLQN
jgi:L-malate glycosyltransferase